MPALDRARTTFDARLAEIIENAQIRDAFITIFVRRRGELFSHQIDQGLRRELNKALDLQRADASVMYRGLILQIHGAFEAYISQSVAAVVNSKVKISSVFSEIPETLRNAYIVYSANVLSKFHDGGPHGVAYDYNSLQRSLGLCFTDDQSYNLSGDVFTILMGNCTPERLDRLFEVVGIAEPFDDESGRNADVKRWAQNAGAREAAKRLRNKLISEIRRRNLLAHRGMDVAILSEEVYQTADFFKALVSNIQAKARSAMA